ncbi:hypothetical protein LQV63_03075 [Paenibacillus profundus]|uniref:Uncharacterized protein n=1 Tax=Paenibacillus profundus TaxID=1173085 RepID=A0ABS8Y913_9BACL|nr:hypothetical protein [Paenibacillus profundus]MCE5168298.1 hypothetical protein [Paenibacillus profundus]
MEASMGKNDKSKNRYPQLESDSFGVGAVRSNVSLNSNGGTGNTGSCGTNVSCILCCCIGSGGGAENKKIQIEV